MTPELALVRFLAMALIVVCLVAMQRNHDHACGECEREVAERQRREHDDWHIAERPTKGCPWC
jgi:hypothetical protein